MTTEQRLRASTLASAGRSKGLLGIGCDREDCAQCAADREAVAVALGLKIEHPPFSHELYVDPREATDKRKGESE